MFFSDYTCRDTVHPCHQSYYIKSNWQYFDVMASVLLHKSKSLPLNFLINGRNHPLHAKRWLSKCNFLKRNGLHKSRSEQRMNSPGCFCVCNVLEGVIRTHHSSQHSPCQVVQLQRGACARCRTQPHASHMCWQQSVVQATTLRPWRVTAIAAALAARAAWAAAVFALMVWLTISQAASSWSDTQDATALTEVMHADQRPSKPSQ